MQLSELLSLHRAHTGEHGHAEILGDGFLLEHNPVYRRVKERALAVGCIYREATTEYLLMPFQQLSTIVSTHSVPFVPNARLISTVELRRPNRLSSDDLQIPESYHLHEAAHVIADECFGGIQSTDPQERLLQALICESFANTVDAVAWMWVKDDLHYFFLRQNSYMHPTKKYLAALHNLSETVGLRFTVLFTLIAYLHANFLKDKIPRERIRQLLGGVKLSPKVLKECELIRKMADHLDGQFRLLTTKMHLNLEGYDGDVEELLDFPFMKLFDTRPVFSKAVDAMVEVLVSDQRNIR